MLATKQNLAHATAKPLPGASKRRPVTTQRASGLRALATAQPFGPVQAKLKVGPANDRFEAEADRVADQVIRMPAPETTVESRSASGGPPPVISALPGAAPIRRMCADCAEELHREPADESIRRQVADEEEELIQPKAATGTESALAATAESGIAGLGGGSPLPASERAFFEPRFGRDFGDVRIHDGAMADAAAKSINARAFTTRPDIFFRQGAFEPRLLKGRRLLAHELTHIVQQDGRGGALRPAADTTQRSVEEVEQQGSRLARLTTPNPTLPAPPAAANPQPAPAAFAPLSAAELAARQALGVSTDTGTMTSEIFGIVSPTGGAGPSCVPQPANFEPTVAAAVSTALQADVPNLTPGATPDPMAVASASADEAMPIIHTHYSPHAPSVAPATFMANVSRTPASFGDAIRNTDAALGEFLEWYSGANATVRAVTGGKCGMTRTWWVAFAGWLGTPPGAAFDAPPHDIRERSAVFDTFFTSITSGGHIQFGRAFELVEIPHTVVHEAMHLFQHPDLRTQANFLQDRNASDIFIEGFAEYLARGVRDLVVNALQARVPPTFSPADAVSAKAISGYQFYVDKAVELRDTLYRHGQDGEEAIRRAFFLGEGWRFALLETAAGLGSPIETDRPIPPDVDVTFASGASAILNPAALAAIVAYVTTRSIATVEVIGRTDPVGSRAANSVLGQQRANAVRTYLTGQGIDAGRITATSRGELDQIPGGDAVNRRATVSVVDPRNLAPGEPALGR